MYLAVTSCCINFTTQVLSFEPGAAFEVSWANLNFILWSRIFTNKYYFEQLLPSGGSAGQYAAVLGDQRTYGFTTKFMFKTVTLTNILNHIFQLLGKNVIIVF